MITTLQVKPRDAKASVDDLRKEGFVPAVFYGPKEAPTPIAVEAQEFERAFRTAGETTIIALKGAGEDKETLIHDVQWHPITNRALHADFYVLEKGKKVTLSIPLEFVGQAPAEKLGHIVVKSLYEVEIEVAPAELPQQLDVDVSKLENVGDRILVKDIPLPKSAELLTDSEEIVASVTAIVEEAEQAPAAEAAPAEGATGGEAKTE